MKTFFYRLIRLVISIDGLGAYLLVNKPLYQVNRSQVRLWSYPVSKYSYPRYYLRLSDKRLLFEDATVNLKMDVILSDVISISARTGMNESIGEKFNKKWLKRCYKTHL